MRRELFITSSYGGLNENRSFLCEEELYLLELVRYIHLNPIRAGMVEDLKVLIWTT
jgi:hypothetical protein